MTNKNKAILFHGILIVLLGMFFFFLIFTLEMILSFFVVKPDDIYSRHFRLNHVFKPNKPDDPLRIHYNSKGFIEDYEVSIHKPSRTCRIFYVGDSFVAGTALVYHHQSLPALVEQKLHDRYPDVRLEIINAGVSSYSPILYYILIRYYLLNYDPDVIVLNIDMTDVDDDYKYRHGNFIEDEYGNPWGVPGIGIYGVPFLDTHYGIIQATKSLKIHLFLYRYSNIYRFLLHLFRHQIDRNIRQKINSQNSVYIKRWQWCTDEWDETTSGNVNYSMGIVRRIIHLCRDHGVDVVLTGVPHYQQFIKEDSGSRCWSARPHRVLEELAQEENIHYIDSYGFLKPHILNTKQSEFYLPDDMHFNEQGNQLWAQAHYKFFNDHKTEFFNEEKYK
ncbi:MAG: hypothetical protein GF384_08285 [Elusimicrobia bacterium]|nr:hypothetical protein [Elusimicrobiota bacterium]MBD3412625.1 hypothetical protein [Elusimicrobiota bacterium]